MTTAIWYHPEGYTTKGPKLAGRHAAGESFLRGFLTHSTQEEFWVHAQKPDYAKHFAQIVRSFDRKEPIKIVYPTALAGLRQAGVVYYPGPSIGRQAFHRAAFGHGAWSLCGITHTTIGETGMDALAELVTAPVQPWDALICTSTAVKDNVTRLLEAQLDYLKDRLGITKEVLPQLPIIPLGIHTEDFSYTDAQKQQARQAIGADGDARVVLFVGRLSFSTKAHPLAMYQALEKAAKQTGKEVILVECGWHPSEYFEKAYADAAKLACPSVRVMNLDGRKPEDRQTAWASADIFCSLSDNFQETFGIVPVEAMAAGIPVVVTDWDGYRDTVRDGVDGFRIPTLMPRSGLAHDLTVRYALGVDSYALFCGQTCSLVAVDIEATAQAFMRLFDSPELRRQMGEAGRARARELYDWEGIIVQYEALWTELTKIRKSEALALKPLKYPWPARMDPFYAFGSYPTHTLTSQTAVALVDADASAAGVQVNSYRQLAMVNFAEAVLPSEAEVQVVLAAAASGPKPAGELIAAIPAERQAFVFRSLPWLMKLGILRICA